MNAEFYVNILEECLVPFIREKYPDSHHFMQVNDRRAQQFFSEHGIHWWRTPTESPDANPIENLWHEMKVITAAYLCCTNNLHFFIKYHCIVYIYSSPVHCINDCTVCFQK